jgi:hypothetical protein
MGIRFIFKALGVLINRHLRLLEEFFHSIG